MDKVDWRLARSFLAVAEAGSLSAAAGALGLTQPTLSRQIAELEARLGQRLFLRKPRGVALTEAALALLPHARAMGTAAAQLDLAFAGREERLSGTVRVTASRIVSAHHLPRMLAALRDAEPGIEIELVATDTVENLHHRDADIALRMVRPEQGDLVTLHAADLATGLYCSRGYAARHGVPADPAALADHVILGLDRSDLILRLMRGLGYPARREDFPIRCDDQLVYLELIRAGLGIGGAQRLVAARDPDLVAVADFVALPSLPVWLTAHEAVRDTPRIRRVFDHLAQEMRALARAPGNQNPRQP